MNANRLALQRGSRTPTTASHLPNRGLVQPARLHLPLLDPQIRRHLGLVAAYFVDEALGILAAD